MGDGSKGGKECARCAEECYLGYHLAESCEELVKYLRERWLGKRWFDIDCNREFWFTVEERWWPWI